MQQITANPLEAVDTSRVPTLILYGRRDLWVPVEPSVLALERQPSRHPQVTLRVIADADHALMMNVDPRGQMNAALAVKDAPDAPAHFTTLAPWLMAHGAAGGLPRP